MARDRAGEPGWISRERALALVLLAVTALALYLCYRLVEPFLPALAWALALGVVASPLHRRLTRYIPRSSLAAALAVAAVTLLIIGPVVVVSQRLVVEGQAAVDMLQRESEHWRGRLERHPQLAPLVRWIDTELDWGDVGRRVAEAVGQRSGAILTGSVWAVMQLLITIFLLFYFLRDRSAADRLSRSLLPLSDLESEIVFRRVAETIRATVFGTLAVAGLQGCLGGLMFWLLGLPGPLFWGVVMALLATIPVLGTFLVWAPAAIFLAVSGSWVKAIALAAWGGIAIALIDNLLYPVLVGNQLRLHPVPVFFSLVGGLALFGAAGLILGPLTLAVTIALLDIWRWRTAGGHTAESPVDGPGGVPAAASRIQLP